MDCFVSFLSVAFAVFLVSLSPLQAVNRKLVHKTEATTDVTFFKHLTFFLSTCMVYIIKLSIYVILWNVRREFFIL